MPERVTRRRLHAALLAALAGWVPAVVRAEEEPPPPLAWQEPSPVARLFFQPAFEAPEPLPAGRLGADLRVIYSNSLLLARTPALTLVTDVETARPTLQLSGGLGAGIELRAALPLVVDWGGLFDRPIEAIDGFFGAPLGERHSRPRDTAQWTLLRPDGSGLSREGAGAGLGDASVGLKARLLAGGGGVPAVSARATLGLPTGRLPWGAGQVIPAAGLLAAWRLPGAALRLAFDVAVPTARLRQVDLPTQPYGSVDLGLTLPLSEGLWLQLQGSGHRAPLHATGIDRLDSPTWYVLWGITARLSDRTTLDFGMVENVFSPYRGADASLLVAIHGR